MATEFETAFETAFDVLKEFHGNPSSVTITYTADGQAGVSITALWRPQELSPANNTDGQNQELRGEIDCSTTQVPSPSDRDKFVIDGVVYAVERIVQRHPTVLYDLVKFIEVTNGGENRIRT